MIYFSCHGSQISITVPEVRDEQSIILTDNTGIFLRYLTTKDIFNILFGRNYISSIGVMKIPVYKKIKKIQKVGFYKKEVITSEFEFINIKIDSPTESPESENHCYRSSYFNKRGIPCNSKVLIIVDTCHSGKMMHFPFIYSSSLNLLIRSNLYNTYVDHTDLPYCVCISSCEFNNSTKSPEQGSHLTQVIHSHLMNLQEPLNFRQIYNILVNSERSKHFISKKTITPVISCTYNDHFIYIPFFGYENIRKPRKIIK